MYHSILCSKIKGKDSRFAHDFSCLLLTSILTLTSSIAYSSEKELPISISIKSGEFLISINNNEVENYSLARQSLKNGTVLKNINKGKFVPTLLPKNDGTGNKLMSTWKNSLASQSDGIYSEIVNVSVTRKDQPVNDKKLNYNLFFYYSVKNGIVTSIDPKIYSDLTSPTDYMLDQRGNEVAFKRGGGSNRVSILRIGNLQKNKTLRAKTSGDVIQVTNKNELQQLSQSLGDTRIVSANKNESGAR